MKKLTLAILVQVALAFGQTQVDSVTQLKNTPILDHRSFNFVKQRPGGSLSIGTQTITMRPCPQGMNGTNTNYSVYISDGVGTAEVAAVSGGTCTSGATTGTLIITVANTHSGSWSVSSSTAGIMEAQKVLKVAGHGGTIQLSAGVFTICGTVNIDTDNIVIAGAGSIGSGPNAASSPSYGVSGTSIVPCSANQTLFNVPYGHLGGSVGLLSMHDVGFYNNGLAGITAIKTIHDNYTQFSNINFAGTTNVMWGFYIDRSFGISINNVVQTGTAGSFFGSSTDTTAGGEFPYSEVTIVNWQHFGPATSRPAITFQRCVGCGLSHSRFSDFAVTMSGTALQILNDCQGVEITDFGSESYALGIFLSSNTVGSTTIAPGWTTITDAQLDGGSTFTGIQIGSGVYEVAIINPTFTAVSTTGYGIIATGTPASHQVMRVIGGYFGITQPTADIILNTPITGVTIIGNTFNSGGPGSAIWLAGAGTVTDAEITDNTLTSTAGIVVTSSIATSHIVNNSCDHGAGVLYCNGAYTGNLPTTDYTTMAGVAAANGTIMYCSNCNSTCSAGGSTGRTCHRENGAWVH